MTNEEIIDAYRRFANSQKVDENIWRCFRTGGRRVKSSNSCDFDYSLHRRDDDVLVYWLTSDENEACRARFIFPSGVFVITYNHHKETASIKGNEHAMVEARLRGYM